MDDIGSVIALAGSAGVGGVLLSLLQWYSNRRTIKITDDGTVIGQAQTLMREFKEDLDKKGARIASLEAEVKEMHAKQLELIQGCYKLSHQLAKAGIEPEWTPDMTTGTPTPDP